MGLFNKLKKQNTPSSTTLVPNVGRMPFPAYRGKEPYIFISYAHLDAEIVFSEIKSFNEQGYNVWYDEGISPGNEWTDEIAHALEKCALFIVMITPNSARSGNVLNEINFALEDSKPIIAIHLVKTELSGGMKLQIGTKQAIHKYDMSEEEYVYKYTSAFTRLGLKPKAKPRPAFDATASSQTVSHTAEPDLKPQTEITIVGDFAIEHGLLREYLGKETDITLPDEAQIVGSLGRGRDFVETVDLNKVGALLNGAFTGCPKLRKLTIPRSVTMIQDRPFIGCPLLTVYCYRDRLPPRFAENFGGKELVYLDDASAVQEQADAVVFKSPEMRRMVCAELGVGEDTVLTKDMCDRVTSLSVCGNAVGRKFNAYTNDGTNVRIVPIAGSNDTMTTVGRGSLDSLEDIPLLRNLTKLTIPYQSVFDLAPLAGSKIERLDLASNMLGDLTPLASMRFLKSLEMSHSQTESFAQLGMSRSLRQLTFSGIRQHQFDGLCETGNVSLTVLMLSSSRYLTSINGIENLKNLESLYISETHVTDIEPALSLKYLVRLGIRGLDIPDLSVIRNFTGLKTLSTDKKQEETVKELYGGTFPYKAY
ncbi:MAG: TIR domain-containing protein [Oscillospiraceae bacterium]|nr:TIR domain-containing protein [Oscillospiraceae bacterium]